MSTRSAAFSYRSAVGQPPGSATFAMMMVSSLLIGADLLSLRFGGFTFRVVTIPLLLSWILIFSESNGRFQLDPGVLAISLALCTSAVLSLAHSYDDWRTIGYTLWLIFTFFVIVPVFYNFARSYTPLRILRLWFLVYRVHVVLLVLEVVIRVISFGVHADNRPHLFFYEPSYAAIFLSAYVGSSMYLVASGHRWARRDLLASLGACTLLLSATALFAITLAVLVNIIAAKYRWKLLFGTSVAAGAFGTALVVFLHGSLAYDLLAKFLVAGDLKPLATLQDILFRGGSRIVRALWGWSAFMQHPIFGIGFGADQTYTRVTDVPDLAEPFVTPFMDLSGNPFVNPFIEAAGTMGVLGLAAFIALILDFLRRCIELPKEQTEQAVAVRAFFVGFLVMFLVLQAEGTFLRFYVWSTLGLAYGALASWRECRKHCGWAARRVRRNTGARTVDRRDGLTGST